MFRLKQQLAKINKLDISFNIIIEDEKTTKLETMNHTEPKLSVRKYKISENRFLDVTFNGYISLDISRAEDSSEGRSPARRITLNKFDTFRLLKVLNILKEEFINIKDLFVYDSSHNLSFNRNYSGKIDKKIVTSNNKAILIIPSTVPDKYKETIMHEGIILSINTIDNYVYLNFEEMEYLIYILNKIDFDILGDNLIMIHYLTTNNIALKPVTIKEKVEPIKEEIVREPIQSQYGGIALSSSGVIPNF